MKPVQTFLSILFLAIGVTAVTYLIKQEQDAEKRVHDAHVKTAEEKSVDDDDDTLMFMLLLGAD